MKTSSSIFWNLSICFPYKQFRQYRFPSLASFRSPTFETSQSGYHPRSTIFMSERLPVRDRILRLERARPVRDRLINVIMWEKPLLSSCARNRPFRRRNPEERFRSLFFLKEIPLAMETVPESGTGSVSSRSTRDPAVWPRDPEYPPLAPTPPLTANSFLLRRMVCIVRWDACTPCRRWLWTHP